MIPNPSHPKRRKIKEPDQVRKFILATKAIKIHKNRSEKASSSIYLWAKRNTLPEISITTILNLTLILSIINDKVNVTDCLEKNSNSIIHDILK